MEVHIRIVSSYDFREVGCLTRRYGSLVLCTKPRSLMKNPLHYLISPHLSTSFTVTCLGTLQKIWFAVCCSFTSRFRRSYLATWARCTSQASLSGTLLHRFRLVESNARSIRNFWSCTKYNISLHRCFTSMLGILHSRGAAIKLIYCVKLASSQIKIGKIPSLILQRWPCAIHSDIHIRFRISCSLNLR